MTEETKPKQRIKTTPFSPREKIASGESFKKVVKEEIKTVTKVFADNVQKTKYILERTYANGVRKCDIIALHKDGKGFIFNRSKSFGVDLPDMGAKAK